MDSPSASERGPGEESEAEVETGLAPPGAETEVEGEMRRTAARLSPRPEGALEEEEDEAMVVVEHPSNEPGGSGLGTSGLEEVGVVAVDDVDGTVAGKRKR